MATLTPTRDRDRGAVRPPTAARSTVAERTRTIWLNTRCSRVHAAYARLRGDPEQWAEYQQELRLAENTAADGLGEVRDEYPEYNS